MTAPITQGRLTVRKFKDLCDLEREDGEAIAVGLSEADAHHMVACWGFCHGFDAQGLDAIQGGMHGLLLQGAEEQEALAATRTLLEEVAMELYGTDRAATSVRIRAFLKGGA
jgi:hypothetical protein